jgi:hypothetical protein
MLLEFSKIFKEENIIENLMNFYKDFNYTNYIVDSEFETGYKLFLKMKQREEKATKEKYQDMQFQNWLRGQTELSFKDFLDQQERNLETKKMTGNERDKEEERIINKYQPENFDLSQFKRGELDV